MWFLLSLLSRDLFQSLKYLYTCSSLTSIDLGVYIIFVLIILYIPFKNLLILICSLAPLDRGLFKHISLISLYFYMHFMYAFYDNKVFYHGRSCTSLLDDFCKQRVRINMIFYLIFVPLSKLVLQF